MKKLILLTISILVILIVLVGCINNSNSNENNSNTDNTIHTHSFGEWTVTKEASCIEYGLKIRTCECGEHEEETISVSNHNYEYFEKKDEIGNNIVIAICKNEGCESTTELSPGLYDANYNLLSSWDDLVDIYEMDIEKDYTFLEIATWEKNNIHITYIIKNNENLSTGTKLIVDNSVSRIGDYALYACETLTDLVIPEGITSIGLYSLVQCKSLTSIIIPNSVTSIGDRAFYFCTALQSVKLSDNLTDMGDFIFAGCSSLLNITLPNSITYISNYTFEGCSSLTSIQIPPTITALGKYSFANCTSLCKVTIPESVTDISPNSFIGCSSLENFIVDESNPQFEAIDGHLYNKPEKIFLHYANGKDDTEFIVPDGTKGIGNSAFSECNKLVNIELPDSLTSIGTTAFYECNSLTKIVIPASVTTIGDAAFTYCNLLKNIHFEGTEEQWIATNYAKRCLPEGVIVHFEGKKQFYILGYAGYFGSSGAAGYRLEVIVENNRVSINNVWYDDICYVEEIEFEYSASAMSYNDEKTTETMNKIKENKGWYILEGVTNNGYFVTKHTMAVCCVDGIYYFIALDTASLDDVIQASKIHYSTVGQ